MEKSDAQEADDADPGQEDDRLIALAAAYDEALARGETSPSVVLGDDTLEEDAKAEFEQARRVLERLAHIRSELSRTTEEPESWGSLSWFGLNWRQARSAIAVSDENLMPRQLGRFEIVRELGRGGHGVVLLARDPVLQRDVALKVPRPEALLTSDSRRRFAKEAQAAARLSHPNLVPVYEAGEFGPICFIASAYCEGPTLAAWLAARTKLVALRRAASWTAVMARAIDYAHSQDILHRDLKPSNVLLVRTSDQGDATPAKESEGDDLEPQITDFGLAKSTKAEGTHTRTGTMLGTPAYMAPEQADGRLGDVGPGADVYALGTMLYEMLTGRPPFLAESDLETLRQVSQDEPLSLRRLQRHVPRDLETICLKCLEKNPARRYPTAAEMADDLTRYLNSQPIAARRAFIWRRGWLWTRRHPTQSVVWAVLLAVGITLPAGLFWHSIRLQREHDDAIAARAEAQDNARIARDNEARVRENVYAADMRVANRLREEGDFTSLPKLLDRYATRVERAPELTPGKEHVISSTAASDSRGFEWRYLDRFCHIIRSAWPAHSGDVDRLSFSGAGDMLVTTSMQEGLVKVWEIPSGRLRQVFDVRKAPARRGQESIADLSADGSRLASLIDLHTIVVWDVETRAEIVRLRHKQVMHAVALLSDGAHVVGAGDVQTLVWHCDSGQVIHEYPGARLVAVCPGDRQLGLVDRHPSSNTLRLCDVPQSPAKREFPLAGPVRQVVYAPNGSSVAFLNDTRLSSDIQVIHPRISALCSIPATRPGGHYRQIGFSHDGNRLAGIAPDGALTFWDLRSGNPLSTVRGPATRLTQFVISADNRWLATAEPSGIVRIWDHRLLDVCDELVPSNTAVGPVAFSADDTQLAVATADRGALLISGASGHIVRRLPRHLDPIRDLAFSPDGTRLLTTDGESNSCWNLSDGKPSWSVPANFAVCVDWSPQMPVVASAGADRQIRLFNSDDGSATAVLTGHTDTIRGLRFMAGSDLMISAGQDGTIRFWNVVTQKAVGEPIDAGGPIDQIKLSADGKVLVAGFRSGVFSVWRIKEDRSLENLHRNGFWELGQSSMFSLSHDGRILFVGSFSGPFRAVDLKTNELLSTVSGRRIGGMSIASSGDDKRMATVSREGCLTLWDLEQWRTMSLEGSPLSAVRSLAFSPDSSSLAIATDDSRSASRPDSNEPDESPRVRGVTSVELQGLGAPQFDGRPWDASGPGFRIWNVADGREQAPLNVCETAAAIPLAAWSRRGLIATGSRDGTVWVWNAASGQLVTRFAVNPHCEHVISWKPLSGHFPIATQALDELDDIVAVTFSSDGGKLAVATRKGLVQLVTVDDWDHRATLCSGATGTAVLAFTHSGSMLATNRGGQLVCWDLDNLESSNRPRLVGPKGNSPICAVAFAHDGRTLAIGREDGTAELLDAQLLDPLHGSDEWGRRSLQGHFDRVASLSFSHDDRTLASGSWDATVRLWHVASGQEIATLKAHHGRVEAVAFSPDGTVLATAGRRDPDRGEVFLWRADRAR